MKLLECSRKVCEKAVVSDTSTGSGEVVEPMPISDLAGVQR